MTVISTWTESEWTKPKTHGEKVEYFVFGVCVRVMSTRRARVAEHIVFYVSSLKCAIHTRQTTIKYLIKRNYLNFINEKQNAGKTKRRKNIYASYASVLCKTVSTSFTFRQMHVDGIVCISGWCWL